MREFKVGDKVRRICDPANCDYYKLQLDRAYYITEIKFGDIRIKGNGTNESCWWIAGKFELVKPNPRKL